MDSHTVTAAPTGSLDRYASTVFDRLVTRSAARKAIQRGYLRVDGKQADPRQPVVVGSVLTLRPAPPRAPFRMDVEVVHLDPHMAVVYKPPGVPTKGVQHRTLEHALLHNLEVSPLPDGLVEPRCVHRLDTRTQGLVVVGRTGTAVAALGRLFEERQVRKTYEALVVGRLEGEGRTEAPLEEREADTTWRALAHYRSPEVDWLTHVQLQPHTGRRHQLRIHLAQLGHPVLGDDLYDMRPLRGKGLFLAAVGVELPHPITGDAIHITTDAPRRFRAFGERSERRWRRREAASATGPSPPGS